MSLPKPYYQDDAVAIFHGDCREIAPHIAADVIVTDPPYGISYSSGWSKETRAHSASIAGDSTTELRDWAVLKFADKPCAYFATPRCRLPMEPRVLLVWDKGEAAGMGDLSVPWKPNWEVIWIGGEGWTGVRSSSVLRGKTMVTSSAMGRCHPHEKPVWLLSAIIAKAPNGLVLDPFMGSGTTLRAAKDLGRKAIGIEIEERYCEIAAKRMQQEVLPLGGAA